MEHEHSSKSVSDATSVTADKLEEEGVSTEKEDVDNVKTNPEPGNDNRVIYSQEKMDTGVEMEGKLKEDVGNKVIVDSSLELPREEENEGCYYEEEEEIEPVFDGTEIPGMEACRSLSSSSLDLDSVNQRRIWSDRAVALKNLVRDKSISAVSTLMRRVSGKRDDFGDVDSENYGADSAKQGDLQEKSFVTKGRVIVYTKSGCEACKETRRFLHTKRLRYIEINIDVYPGRKSELERLTGSSSVPKIFFNEVIIGGLNEVKSLDESGKLKDKLDYVIAELPSPEAPLPPLSGEDDASSSALFDESAVVVRKMKKALVVKDRFYKMRLFASCFVGSEAVDFIGKDLCLEREEAVQFGRNLVRNFFFQNILDENVFEDSNHLYRFLDDNPAVATQCYNIRRGIVELKPNSVSEIASRLSFLCNAIFEAYASEDRRHIDYRSIHGSEEFARYLRIVEGLQRVELLDMVREVKLSLFINLYNMMTIHAILVWGPPSGPLDRAKILGDFKYVIGGCTYSPSGIYNGVLRGNQRPPYTPIKPFSAKDKRSRVAFPTVEPLIHFALSSGTRSGPVIKSYSPENIDAELIESGRDFLTNGGIHFDVQNRTIYVSKILKWFSVDFGKNEFEVLKYASNYLETANSDMLLELLMSNTQCKITYQAYDWKVNC